MMYYRRALSYIPNSPLSIHVFDSQTESWLSLRHSLISSSNDFTSESMLARSSADAYASFERGSNDGLSRGLQT